MTNEPLSDKVIPENTTLVIEEADLRDSGVYKVLASNDEGVAEYAFTVIVGKKSQNHVVELRTCKIMYFIVYFSI